MDSSTRSAHRHVGTAAIAAFLALLLLGLGRGPASANQVAPAATPSQQQPPDFGQPRGEHRFRGGDGPDFDDGGGGLGFGGGDPGGGSVEPAPSAPSDPGGGSVEPAPSAPSDPGGGSVEPAPSSPSDPSSGLTTT